MKGFFLLVILFLLIYFIGIIIGKHASKKKTSSAKSSGKLLISKKKNGGYVWRIDVDDDLLDIITKKQVTFDIFNCGDEPDVQNEKSSGE